MNKIIFQIGILGFCVAAVVFGGNGGSVLDVVSRSFIVFVGIILVATVVVLVGGTMIGKHGAQRGTTPQQDTTKTHN